MNVNLIEPFFRLGGLTLLMLASVVLLSATACSKKQPPGAQTPAPTASDAVSSSGGQPKSSATPTIDILQVPATIWVIDAGNDRVTTLREDPGPIYAYSAEFSGDPGFVVLHYRGFDIKVRFDGTEASQMTPESDCRAVSGGFEIRGRVYTGVNCGLISPDGRAMIYRLPPLTGRETPGSLSDVWLLDLTNAQSRLLQDGLHDCGGCDGRFGAGWSHSGRYMYFSETGPPGRVFLGDAVDGTSRQLSAGKNGLTFEPDWSPNTDVLLYPTSAGTTVLGDFATGTSRDLPDLAWPARFDASGTYVYSPGWSDDPKRSKVRETTVADARTGAVVAKLPGTPPPIHVYSFLPRPLVATRDSFVAILEGAPDCTGTAVYADARLVTCVKDGVWAMVSPDGARVALSRQTGKTGRAHSPTIQTNSFNLFDIIIVDVATGREETVARNALGEGPPQLIWNQASTHVMVRWPMASYWGYGP